MFALNLLLLVSLIDVYLNIDYLENQWLMVKCQLSPTTSITSSIGISAK